MEYTGSVFICRGGEMANTLGLGPSARKGLWVQVPPSAFSMHYTTQSEQTTRSLARKFARQLRGGDVVLLQGELGTGKTTFVKGLAAAFGIKEKIKSPTFVLIHVHRIVHRRQFTVHSTLKYFVHCDAYRVKIPHELMKAGLLDWLGRPDTVVVIEWGEKMKPLIKGNRVWIIRCRHGRRTNERVIRIFKPR